MMGPFKDDIQYSINNSSVTLANDTSAQSPFAAAHDTFTVVGLSTYEFEALIMLENSGASTTSHGTSFLFGGTATFTSVAYDSMSWSPNTSAQTALNTQTTKVSNTATANGVVNASTTSKAEIIKLRGLARINAGGTLIPQIQFSAAVGGTESCLENSYFRLLRVGSNTFTGMGSVG